MPRDRIDVFTMSLDRLCDEADLPRYDDTHYDVLRDELIFIWRDPEFVLAADLAHSSVYGLTAEALREQWERKLAKSGA